MITPTIDAQFIATLRAVEGTEWQASCKVIADHLSHVDVEPIGTSLFSSEVEARKWVHGQAAVRGFEKLLVRTRRH